MLYVNGVPLAVRQRITSGAKARNLSNADYIGKLVQLHDTMIDTATDPHASSRSIANTILDGLGLAPVQR